LNKPLWESKTDWPCTHTTAGI